MSHIRHIASQSHDRSETIFGTYPESATGEPLLLCSYDCHWEERWQDSSQRLKVADMAYYAACGEGAESPLIAQLKSVLAQREFELHRVFLSQFRTTDEYADWRLEILDLELRWLRARPHTIAAGLPMAEIMRRLDAVRIYALGFPLSNPAEPPPESRRMVSDILERPPTPEVIRMVARLRRQGGDEAQRSANG